MSLDLGNIQKDSVIAVGMRSVIYRSFYDDKYVVIKEIQAVDKTTVGELKQYINMLKRVSHPFVLQFYGSILDENKYLNMIFDYCELQDFSYFIGTCSDELKYKVIMDVTIALRYLHSLGIVHMNIQPKHILMQSIDINFLSQ